MPDAFTGPGRFAPEGERPGIRQISRDGTCRDASSISAALDLPPAGTFKHRKFLRNFEITERWEATISAKTFTRFLPLAVFAVAVVAVGGTVLYSNMGHEPSLDGSATPQRIAQGKAVYTEYCASCHGAELEGQPNWRSRNADGRLPAPPHDPSGHTWHHPDQMLFVMTKFGPQATAGPDYQSDMPGFEGILTDQEIIDVLTYIKSTWPENIRQEQARRTAASLQNGS